VLGIAAGLAYAPAQAWATISGQSASNTDTTVTYTYGWTGTNVARRDVFIDTDRISTRGFAIGGIGAEFLVQDGALYSFAGTVQNQWAWTRVTSASVTFSAGSPASFTLSRADLGETNACAESSDVVFRTEDATGATVDVLPAFTHTFTPSSSCLKLGMASYFSVNGADFAAVEASGPGEVSFVVANPASGPGSAKLTSWDQQLSRLKNAGFTVYGYIKSRQNGVPSRARQAADYVADIDRWYIWYGTYLSGLFIDEEYNHCTSSWGPNGESNFDEAAYYRGIVAYMKQSRDAYSPTAGVKVILNPGGLTDECLFRVNNTPDPTQDIIQANFESHVSNYASFNLPAGRWELNYSKDKFWHLVYGADRAAMEQAISAAQSKHVGYFYAVDVPFAGCLGQGTWNLLPGRCLNDTGYFPRLKELTSN